MATGTTTGGPNLPASYPPASMGRKGSKKTFSRSPNPADSGALGNTWKTPPLTEEVSDDSALSEPALRTFFATEFTIADNTRRPRELVWHQCWDLYNGTYDWSAKSWWQSRANIPEVRAAVDRAVAIFRKSLLRLRKFYQITSDTKKGKAKGLFTSALLDYWLDQSDAIDEMLVAIKAGLITSNIILKVWWQQVREQMPDVIDEEVPTMKFGVQTGTTTKKSIKFKEVEKGRFAIRAVDPFNFWVIPKTNRFAVIERTYATYDEIESLAKKGVYRKEVLDRVKNYLGPQTVKASQEARRANEMPTPSDQYVRQIELFHYWGDIYNNEGRVVMADASFTMVGKEILLRAARPNPFYHKLPPYIFGTAYTVPFATYNRGMVEDVYEIAKSITELTNLIIDGAMYDALKSFAIDIDLLEDPSEANNGLYPGKTFLKRGSQAPPGVNVVETINVGKVPQEAMNALSMLHQSFQKGTFVNSWVSGEGQTSSGTTLGEVNIRTQSALEGLDEAARNVESTVLEPVLDMAARVIYQFHQNYSLPTLVQDYPETAALLEELTPVERYIVMMKGFEFEARGLSVMIDQQQQLGELGNILTIISHIPGLIQLLDPNELLEMILMPFNWNTEKLILARTGQQPNPTPLTPQNAGAMTDATSNPALTPAQAGNAQAGAMAGGATNNPSAANMPGNPQAQQLIQMVLQRAMAGGGR